MRDTSAAKRRCEFTMLRADYPRISPRIAGVRKILLGDHRRREVNRSPIPLGRTAPAGAAARSLASSIDGCLIRSSLSRAGFRRTQHEERRAAGVIQVPRLGPGSHSTKLPERVGQRYTSRIKDKGSGRAARMRQAIENERDKSLKTP